MKSIVFIKNIIIRILKKIIPNIDILWNKNISFYSIESTLNASTIKKNVKLYPPYHISESEIGEYTYIAGNSHISYTKIGKFCSIGPNLLCGWGIHPLNGISTHPMFYSTRKQNGISLSNINKIEERKQILKKYLFLKKTNEAFSLERRGNYIYLSPFLEARNEEARVVDNKKRDVLRELALEIRDMSLIYKKDEDFINDSEKSILGVIGTEEEIKQAIDDYNNGLFGFLED